MAVTVEDVRNQLNGMTEAELISKLIEMEIKSALRKSVELGMSTGTEATDEYVRKQAAYKSFIHSNLYSRIEIHDLEAQIAIKEKLKALKEDADDALDEALGGDEAIDSTPMFDERPEDPNETQWPHIR